jgi:hypothetical protein
VKILLYFVTGITMDNTNPCSLIAAVMEFLRITQGRTKVTE